MRRCNLACEYCNEYDDFSKPVPLDEMLRRIDHLGRLGTSVITISGGEPPAPYEGSGVCYAEFGGGLVSKVEINFLRGDAPEAHRYEPSLEYAAEKAQFGAVRRARWFGRS